MYRKFTYNSKTKIFRVKLLDKNYIVKINHPSSFKQTVYIYEEEESVFSIIARFLSTLRKKFSFLIKKSKKEDHTSE